MAGLDRRVLQDILHVMAVNWGLGTGLAVIVLTTGVRASLLPLTWLLAYRAALRKAKLTQLAPALKLIRERYATDRQAQMRETLALHRQHGLSMADGKGLLGALLQMPVIYGLYVALRNADGYHGISMDPKPGASGPDSGNHGCAF